MIDRLEILLSRLRRLFSRTRWSTRILGLAPRLRFSDEPGLVLIQVDGLGEAALRRAMEEGTVPFLAHLTGHERHELRTVYSGLPSNTPGFQAELFYGVRASVPSFSFRDPELGRMVRLSEPETVAALEARLRRSGPGLLEEGSVWSGIYDGGAAETHLGVVPTGGGRLRNLWGRLRIAGIVLVHAWSVLRVGANLVFITALAFRDWLRGRIDRRELAFELRYVPFRVIVGAAFRELIAAGASIDAERGLPVIHLNFAGFDEFAHRRGPTSRSARWTLKGIDRAVERVWSAAHRSKGRDYQVWIYSDHGHETVTPYERRTGRALGETVTRVYAMVREIVGARGAAPPSVAFSPTLGEARSRTLAAGLPGWLAAGNRPGGNGAGRTASPPVEGAVEVVHRGPVGFVYLPKGHDRAFVAWFAEVLAAEGAIPWVLLPEGRDRALAFSADGRFYRLPEEGAAVLGPGHPHLDAAVADLIVQAHHPGAGDLMLLGWDPAGPLSFEWERGSHGGPGPAETSAFVLLPPETRTFFPIPERLRPADLRRMALRVLDRERPEAEPAGAPALLLRGAAEPRPEASVAFRLMTYNVHGCRGMDGKFAPQRVARVIARERPDVVCLQEVDQDRARSGGVDQVAVIARRLRTDYRFHAVAEVDDGAFGNAVLSSHPIRVVEAGPLPAAERVKDMFNLEARGALWVTVEIAGARLNVVNTHLSILERERRIQVDALLGPRWLKNPECGDPVVLTGDFNASPDSWSVRRLETRLRSAVDPDRKDRNLRTWSGRMPLRRIDHVMLSGGLDVLGVHVPRNRLTRVASDHLPLVVDLSCRVCAELSGAVPVESR